MSIEYHYLMQLSPQLEQFKVKKTSPLLVNFRCPICKDSKTNKFKTRGYVIEQPSKAGSTLLTFYCHNCRASMKFATFLERINPTLYQSFLLDRFKQYQPEQRVVDENTLVNQHIKKLLGTKTIPKISSLREDHVAKQYVVARKIPARYHYKLYYINNYAKHVTQKDKGEDPRLIFNFVDKVDSIGIQGRTLIANKTPKFVTTVFDKSKPFVFGLDNLDVTKTIWVFEGPLDSMMVDNGIAIAGISKISEQFEAMFYPYRDNIVFCIDNEVKNQQVLSGYRSIIAKGYNIVIWPKDQKEKDINDLVINRNYTPEQAENYLRQHLHTNLAAELAFTQWSNQ